MTLEKYTSINVLGAQHTQLKRIAGFKNIRITDLGVQMAQKYIDEFMEKHGSVMAEMEELEKRMAQLRVRFEEPK
ncbi:hypothetical protein MYX84_13795 [Acidobacteria bacterium AH-259-O06]|nr:hypothetical protein [Acidobacteria bacterium AH-259-O06]